MKFEDNKITFEAISRNAGLDHRERASLSGWVGCFHIVELPSGAHVMVQTQSSKISLLLAQWMRYPGVVGKIVAAILERANEAGGTIAITHFEDGVKGALSVTVVKTDQGSLIQIN